LDLEHQDIEKSNAGFTLADSKVCYIYQDLCNGENWLMLNPILRERKRELIKMIEAIKKKL